MFIDFLSEKICYFTLEVCEIYIFLCLILRKNYIKEVVLIQPYNVSTFQNCTVFFNCAKKGSNPAACIRPGCKIYFAYLMTFYVTSDVQHMNTKFW